MRIMLDPPGFLMLELKWARKPKYRQPKGREVRFPVGRWVEVEMHLRLSEKADGVVELWQDGVPLVECQGPDACRWRERSTTTWRWASAPTASAPDGDPLRGRPDDLRATPDSALPW